MSMNDPISDLLTRIRNAQSARLPDVLVTHSKIKENIVQLLVKEGYIAKYDIVDIDETKKNIKVQLKYYKSLPVIKTIKRISKPGLRKYIGNKDMPQSVAGIGSYVMSTSKGIMTDAQARELKLGGEIMFEII